MYFVRTAIFSFCAISSLFMQAMQYQITDLGKLINDEAPNSYAVSINDKSQVGGIINPTRMWFAWDPQRGVTKIPINLSSATHGPGCPPYISTTADLSDKYTNDQGQYVSIENGKLYLWQGNRKELIDTESEWLPQYDVLRINNNSEVVGTIQGENRKNIVKYINLKNKRSKLLEIKYSCCATAINDLGEVIGVFQSKGAGHTVYWKSDGSYEIIKKFRGASINNNSIIVGVTVKDGRYQEGAFWENGLLKKMDKELGLFEDMSQDFETIRALSDINNKNEMVGWGKARQGIRPILIKKIDPAPQRQNQGQVIQVQNQDQVSCGKSNRAKIIFGIGAGVAAIASYAIYNLYC